MFRADRIPVACMIATLVLALLPRLARSQQADPPRRYFFDIDPHTPLHELLPKHPKAVLPAGPLLDDDPAKLSLSLTDVPEVKWQDPAPISSDPQVDEKLIAHQIAKINHLNRKKTDYFIESLVAERADLAGLPFQMGRECRQTERRSKAFVQTVELVRTNLRPGGGLRFDPNQFWQNIDIGLWKLDQARASLKDSKALAKETTLASIDALVQILGSESAELQAGLAKYLGGIARPEATRALVRLAIFAAEDKVRLAALQALRSRPVKEMDDLLLAGLRYPWPVVAKNTTAALVALKRADLAPRLVQILNEPDPRVPFVTEVQKKKTKVVRELVRIHHNQNCLLCHAPGNTPDVKETDVVLGSAQVFETGYYKPESRPSPDILVRADVTYLRQDFSRVLRVPSAKSVAFERFDFMVRTRVIDEEEAKRYHDVLAKSPSPYRTAVHTALKALTGRDAEPNAAAWRKVLEKS